MKKFIAFKGLLYLFLASLCWGPSYAFIKIALQDFSPLTIVFLRIGIGFLVLYLICWIKKENLWSRRSMWRQLAILGFFINVGGLVFVCYSQRHISSSLAGILNSFVLICVALLSHFFVPEEKLTWKKWMGIGLGILGILVIYLPLLFEQGISKEIGIWLVILSTFFCGIGTVYARTHLKKDSAHAILTIQLGLSALIVLPFMLLIDRPFSLPPPALSSILASIGLGVIGAAGGFFFYYKAIDFSGPSFASLAYLLVPVVAMVIGTLFMDEHLAWNSYLGVVFILSGILLINPVFKKE